ncbi:hypothetical protein [Mycolicibacterium brumae]|uniref:Uncharacterized protein n=1 Tax=Mycolicibacterium brumae TaxID=85968 RepID=A0A2G5P5C5_9MYCO|nr:hypothetical protein [Mycolicibacterium brumae]MCV7194700.1 hypothetical protein [Mycolicibacterium brumae]PIB73467.1 hypothetical protein CQY22_016615 [Mycolicibacterium brumae]RWA15197.1 hypothetical protein MBRU_11305 [Mycolicibacterium brumae DSM 44177]UWW08266.1 hypothetical protein L2Z93_001314 [Mycolicibacterium brumae]
MFTAGNIKWTLRQRPSYLPSKDEVLAHFEHCLDTIAKDQRVDRDLFFPEGIARWRGGVMFSAVAAEFTARFNGANEDEVWDWFRRSYGLWATPHTGNLFLGLLSEAERVTVDSALNQVVMDHLVDVIDDDEQPRMLLRSGASLPLRPGSWMVNCTGYLNHLDFPYEPYLSPSGTTLSIQPQSAIMHLTSFGAYFGTHLFLSDRLSDAGLYEVDLMELYNASRKVFPPTLFALAAHNLSLCVDALPASAFRECGLDFDRWYPLPRRSIAQLKFLRQHRADRERARHALDTVRARYGVRCGPLSRELPRIA